MVHPGRVTVSPAGLPPRSAVDRRESAPGPAPVPAPTPPDRAAAGTVTGGASLLVAGRRVPPLLGPLAVGVAGVIAGVVAHVVDLPYRPLCPFLVLTGYWCPGCGSSRALHALAHGDLAEALARNPMTTVTVPLLVFWWAAWLYRTATGRTRTTMAHPAFLWALLVFVIAFWVLRNLPGMAWLAP